MLALLSICLNSYAQAFTPVIDEFHESTVVYANVSTTDGAYMPDGAMLYAFIGDECRGEAYVDMSQTEPPFRYFRIKVYGDVNDMNKVITFKVVTPKGYVYSVDNLAGRILYEGEHTHNQPNSLVTLSLDGKVMETLGYKSYLFANVGDEIPYSELVSVFPDDCVIPENYDDLFTVSVGNYTQFAQIIDVQGVKKVKALKKTTDQDPYPALTVTPVNGTGPVDIKMCFTLPMTGVQLKDGVSDTYTIAVDREQGYETELTQKLTNFLHGCYDILPVGADADELFWKAVEGQTVVEVCSLRTFKPIGVGETTLSLVQDLWNDQAPVFLTMTIKVVEPVTDIVVNHPVIYGLVGDDLSALVNADYTVLPAEAEDKSVTISSNNLSVVDADLKAVATGRTTIKIQSNSDPTKTAEIGVVISEMPTITITNQTLSYMVGNLPTSAALTTDITGNYSIAPAGNEFAVTCFNSEVLTVTKPQGTYSYALTGKTGTAIVQVSANYLQTIMKDSPDGASFNDEPRFVDATFSVVVSAQLEGFTINNANFAFGQKSVGTDLVLTPIPAGYPIDMDKLEVKVNSNLYVDNDPWEIAELSFTSASENGIVYNLTPKSVGYGNIVVSYNGQYSDIYFEGSVCDPQVNIGASLDIEPGWSWISIPTGMIGIDAVFGDASDNKIEEIRSQYALSYNDPVYGYFGDLWGIDKGSCYKVKANEPINTIVEYNSDAAYYPGVAPIIDLQPKWNWIGNPYQYQQSITAALGRTGYDEGDMIISKNGQFTTYNNGVWSGTLTSFVPGQGYLFYNNGEKSEINLIAEAKLGSGITSAKSAAESSVWSYDHSKFADNMPVIATFSNIDNTARYTVGAFVGSECRGEGECVNGKYYIGVHGKAGEKVSFKLYDQYTGEYTDVESTMTMGKMAGSYANPVVLEADVTTTGVTTATVAPASADAQLFNAAGQRVSANQKGFVISKNGKFVK